jgi:hypothetical protein
MPPCLQDCTIRNLLKIAMEELDNLNRVREDLDDLSFNEPGRLAEVTAKLKAVTKKKTRWPKPKNLSFTQSLAANSATPKRALSSSKTKNPEISSTDYHK